MDHSARSHRPDQAYGRPVLERVNIGLAIGVLDRTKIILTGKQDSPCTGESEGRNHRVSEIGSSLYPSLFLSFGIRG